MKYSPRMSFDKMLRRHVESASKKGYLSAEDVVDHLRSSNSQYSRQKLKPFTKCVNQIMEELSRINKDDSIGRKRRKADLEEERLQQIEVEHLRKKKRQLSIGSSGGASSSSISTSGSSGDDSGDEVLSISEDSVYEQKFEPEFDMMKSIIRANLQQKSKKLVREIELNTVIESEITETADFEKGKILNENSNSDAAPVKDDKIMNSGRDGNEGNGPFFKDVGGMNAVINDLMDDVLLPFFHSKSLRKLGVKPTLGILLHGPPGCGKTMFAHAIANETGAPFYEISATDLVSGVSGASEENIRELFTKAHRTAPSVVFIDEIDAIALKRENTQKAMECRIVTQLMVCMDKSHGDAKAMEGDAISDDDNCKNGHVLVIGATNRPDAVDPALRRPGRFDREIFFGVPNEKERSDILSVLISHFKVDGSFDMLKIAKNTSGFVGADLSALVNKAGLLALKRTICQRKFDSTINSVQLSYREDWWKKPLLPEEVEKFGLSMADFEEAAKMVQPSSKREGFSTVPSVKWDDVGGLDSLRKEFERYIVQRIKSPKDYEDLGIELATGFLLYGPPGCGKTLIAKAVANEAGANFIYVQGPELLNKYVGEGELAVRTLFRRARTCSPCILFFDEVHSITSRREGEGGGKLLDQLLVELDGAEQRKDVYVIGATNNPQVMDRALLRPGRFGKLLYVPLPGSNERGMILKALARKKSIDPNMDLISFGKNTCENFNGADLAALMNEAAMCALDDKLESNSNETEGERAIIKEMHFEKALSIVSASISNEEIQFYKNLSIRFKASSS